MHIFVWAFYVCIFFGIFPIWYLGNYIRLIFQKFLGSGTNLIKNILLKNTYSEFKMTPWSVRKKIFIRNILLKEWFYEGYR